MFVCIWKDDKFCLLMVKRGCIFFVSGVEMSEGNYCKSKVLIKIWCLASFEGGE